MPLVSLACSDAKKQMPVAASTLASFPRKVVFCVWPRVDATVR